MFIFSGNGLLNFSFIILTDVRCTHAHRDMDSNAWLIFTEVTFHLILLTSKFCIC